MQLFSYAGIQLYKCESMLPFENIGMVDWNYAIFQTCNYGNMQLCKLTTIRVCIASLRVCKYTDIYTCNFASLKVCMYVSI